MRRLAQNQMPVERFDDHCRPIPPPRMQPVRQTAHRVAAIAAHVPPHPNDNPSLAEPADLSAVAAMPLHSHPSAIARQLPASRTESRPELFNRRRARASGAEMLDRNRKAVYNDHRLYGRWFQAAVSPKKAWPQSPPFLSKTTAIILLKSSNHVSRGGLWQEISFWQSRLSPDQDDTGTLPKTGSIGGITNGICFAACKSIVPADTWCYGAPYSRLQGFYCSRWMGRPSVVSLPFPFSSKRREGRLIAPERETIRIVGKERRRLSP